MLRPWETRIRFFAQTGVARGLIKFHIDKVSNCVEINHCVGCRAGSVER